MTVSEHLRFYAGVRGVKNISRNVDNLIRAVGLGPFENRMGSKLSGGNKRKLSLAIALIGNPEVLLLDEPSSGMDPLAKRNMWKTLSRFVPHRSILLTTHSMEEADALADRVGVLAKHMLDVGTTAHLRQKHGHGFHIHLVLASAPQTSQEEAATVQAWIEEHLPGAVMERQCYHGQMRFNVPSSILPPTSASSPPAPPTSPPSTSAPAEEQISVGSIFLLLESNKTPLNLAFHSVSPSTFDEVFLKVVEKHGVSEEDLAVNRKGLSAGDIALFFIFPPLLLYRWAKGRQDAEMARQGGARGFVGQESGVVRGVVPEREVSEVVPEVRGSGVEQEEVVFPNRGVAASTGFSLWPPPLYVLVRNFIRRRRGQ
jgi:ATP-binding cassette subfamily A (ABC1) protein 3